VPSVISRANCSRQSLAMRISSCESAEVAALAKAHAGDKESHRMVLRLRSTPRARYLLLLGQHQVRGQ